MHTGTIEVSRLMKRVAGGLFAAMVSLAAISGCKCGSSSNRDAPAALGSATTGEALPDAVIEIGRGHVTFNGKVVASSEVVEGQNLAMPLQGLPAPPPLPYSVNACTLGVVTSAPFHHSKSRPIGSPDGKNTK